MTRKQRTVAALVLLFAVAGTSYAFLEWQEARPVLFDTAMQVATSTQATSTEPMEDPAPEPLVSDHGFGTITLKLNEIASFPDGLSLRPTVVLEDSRCPENARCIRAGTVRVSVRVRSGTGTSVNEFTPGTTVTTEAEEITLLGVSPENRTGTRISDADYRFTFEVKKRDTGGTGKCFVGGCSAQLCTDDPGAVSTCEYRAEYACYKTARCERQPGGQCGWTETSKLKACLRNPPGLE